MIRRPGRQQHPLVFTNKRIIAANVQGLTGKKTDYTSIPSTKPSIETAGTTSVSSLKDLTPYLGTGCILPTGGKHGRADDWPSGQTNTCQY